MNESPPTSQANSRGDVCVLIAASEQGDPLEDCLRSLRAQTPAGSTILHVPATAAAVNGALAQVAPADVVLLSEPCLVAAGWLERLGEVARADTNTATASALVDVGGELGLSREGVDRERDIAALSAGLMANTLRLHPRLRVIVGPCVYVRREALELVGELDEELELRWALEVDFAQRCVLSGLSHLAADDVLVQPLGHARAEEQRMPAQLRERYPYLSDPPATADSGVLAHALQAARGEDARLWVTLDARALDGAVTGTQVHILELIVALARTGTLRLRLLVRAQRIDGETLELLRGLPATEILAEEEIDAETPRSTVFHRPQQAFSAGDVALAVALGERVVLSQLDLIAYRNPGYFADVGAWEDFRRASRHGLASAERVLVFSDHTRRELLADALVDEQRIRIVAPGLDHRAETRQRRPAIPSAATPGSRGEDEDPLAGPFLLCLGTDFRHKNRLFALRLLAALRADHGWRGSLVLAGTHIPHGSSLELEQAYLVQHPELGEAVVELGAVEEQEKAWLIAHADAVVYPSAYEGFGLVPFESALQGVPCVFAAQSSLAEAAPAGTATILPWEEAQSAAAVHRLLTDEQVRNAHVEALAAAARELTWASAATQIVEIYREAAVAPMREAATLARDASARETQLSAAHAAVVEMLIGERELVLGDYNRLIEELGPGRGLVGSRGALPQELQRGLLAVSARPAFSGALFGGLARVFILVRGLSRGVRGLLGRAR